MSTSALERITSAFDLLNVFQPGESIPAVDGAKGLAMLNGMVKTWNLDALLPPVNSREVFPLVAGKGFPTPYTIGPGGDFNTTRPPTTESLTGATILLGTTGVEIPRALLTDDQYNAIQIKNLPSGLATWVYYNATYAGGLGQIQLYPVPNVATDSLVLYRVQPFAQFASLAASYDLPEGLEEVIDYNLARRLKTPYGKVMDPDAIQMAKDLLESWKIGQVELDDLAGDLMFVGRNPRANFNINTGQ